MEFKRIIRTCTFERLAMKDVVCLYRPVGEAELQLIAAAVFKAFPPRLPEQPIFYPVLNFEYAAQIARNWNTKDKNSGRAPRRSV
ncbi:Hypothetical protein Dalk_0002_AVC [Desulfatibacillum aliphaticivorans]|uniref:Uncharacterized protein n=1 Tax=Desulfatibacillum aliphaticivorans TaxID=218208 RepID=F3ZV43_DESAL|nr:Hypothetical protein Dalk_0002_AVC [Desulfatibacillum aliphaticivorans]